LHYEIVAYLGALGALGLVATSWISNRLGRVLFCFTID
jgi:hypothetical protein